MVDGARLLKDLESFLERIEREEFNLDEHEDGGYAHGWNDRNDSIARELRELIAGTNARAIAAQDRT
jgi:hypothetical protein